MGSIRAGLEGIRLAVGSLAAALGSIQAGLRGIRAGLEGLAAGLGSNRDWLVGIRICFGRHARQRGGIIVVQPSVAQRYRDANSDLKLFSMIWKL